MRTSQLLLRLFQAGVGPLDGARRDFAESPRNLVKPSLPLVVDLLASVEPPLAGISRLFSLCGDPFPLFGCSFPLVGRSFPLVRGSLPLVRGSLPVMNG